MNSPLQDRTLKTSCKNCIFAVYDNDTQISCSFDRIQKFKELDKVFEAFDHEKEFYVINSLCNLYRPLHWNGGVLDKNKAFEESSISYNIYIDCTNLTPEFENKIIDFVNTEYHNNKSTIILYHSIDADSELRKRVIDIYKALCGKVYIASCLNKDEYIHNACMKLKSSYIINIKENDRFDNGILSSINNIINVDLKKFLVIKHKDVYVIASTIYKIENIDFAHGGYQDSKNSIIEKIKDTNLYVEI